MEYPLVSIGMPIYNGEKWVRRSLDSLLNQDYPNIEIIVSDNASEDFSMQILEEYSRDNKNISVSQNDSNIGIIGNFDKVLSLATGKYFFWAGVDDYWEQDFISSLVADLELNDNYAVALSGTRLLSEDGEQELGYVRFTGRDCPNNVRPLKLTGMITSPKKYNYFICGIFRRKLLAQAYKYCPDIPSSDRWFLLQFAFDYGFRYVDKILYVRTIRDKLLYDRYPDEAYGKKKKIIDSKWFDYAPVISVWNMLIMSEVVSSKNKLYIPFVILQLFNQRTILGTKRMVRPFMVSLLPRSLLKYFLRNT